jgi:hypothetical protein
MRRRKLVLRLAVRVRYVPIPAHKVGAFGEKGVRGFRGWGFRFSFWGNLRVFFFFFCISKNWAMFVGGVFFFFFLGFFFVFFFFFFFF